MSAYTLNNFIIAAGKVFKSCPSSCPTCKANYVQISACSSELSVKCFLFVFVSISVKTVHVLIPPILVVM